jgi:predicted transcriptional regulator
MARFKDREKALALRKREYSYSQIKKILKISKSTLSYWLRDYPLSKKRIRELRDWNEQRIKRYRETMKQKREKRLNIFYQEQKRLIFPLSKRELYLAGLFLYWGEGAKTMSSMLCISNTDPSIIKFFIFWLHKTFGVEKDKMRVNLQLYNDMNIEKEMAYWSATLKIPLSQFNKPYVKITSSERINHKGGFGHGTCNVKMGDVRLFEKILMAIKAISNNNYKGM